MKPGIYKCNICNQSFSRKWNAFRHNKAMHGDLATISNNKYKNKIDKFKQNPFQIKKGIEDELDEFSSLIQNY